MAKARIFAPQRTTVISSCWWIGKSPRKAIAASTCAAVRKCRSGGPLWLRNVSVREFPRDYAIRASPFPVGLLLAVVRLGVVRAADALVFEGKNGPGVGKHIVFLTGDADYRWEEGLAQTAKIVAD